ncbi:hypothetical protein H1R20_g5387, partial [Candolleomyces eurysporus]
MTMKSPSDQHAHLDFYTTAEDVFDKLRALVEQPQANADAAALHVHAMALIGRLKFLNRAANTATREKKEATGEARQEMDQSHLGLQNLLYEKRHLEREIEKCRQFASIYQDVPLHSLEDFMELAPEEARRPDEDEHQLMLNRLSFELAERQRLDRKRRDLLKQKEDLLKESKAKTATMENVKSQIELLIKTATEVQKKVDDLVPVPNQSTPTPTGN